MAGEFLAAIVRVEQREAAAKVQKPRLPVPDQAAAEDQEAVRALLLAQRSDDSDYTTKKIEQIVQMGAAVVPSLIGLLRDEDAFVRTQAARSLGDLGPIAEPAVPALIAALGDKKSFVPKRAAEALGTIGPGARSAALALIRLIEKGNMFSLDVAADALVKIDAAMDQQCRCWLTSTSAVRLHTDEVCRRAEAVWGGPGAGCSTAAESLESRE